MYNYKQVDFMNALDLKLSLTHGAWAEMYEWVCFEMC